MKTASLACGLGSRLAEETVVRPKPMVEIGGRPILWHIMRHYLRYGHEEFVIAAGYKGEAIKRWVLDYATLASDVTVRPRYSGDDRCRTRAGDAAGCVHREQPATQHRHVVWGS